MQASVPPMYVLLVFALRLLQRGMRLNKTEPEGERSKQQILVLCCRLLLIKLHQDFTIMLIHSVRRSRKHRVHKLNFQ
jgi:hypothetical protein